MLLTRIFKTKNLELTAGALFYFAHMGLVYESNLLIEKYSKPVAIFFKNVFPVYFNLLIIISEIRQRFCFLTKRFPNILLHFFN